MKKIPMLLLLLSIPASWALAQSPAGLAGLDQPRDYRSLRSSSSASDWQKSNNDRIPVDPGQTVTLLDVQGPGRISHIWFTIAAAERNYSRRVTLRMYWDGESDPSIEAPLGDFFAIGHGMDVELNSMPVRITSNGRARNCYWPMPFRKSARITFTNDGKKPIRSLYYQIDWQKLPSLAGDTPYFHARYRQQTALKPGRHLVLDAEGKGHYVGTVISVRAASSSWIGEGDDFFFIDGETEPSLRGTGTEDYVGDAWGFRRFDGPYYGVPVWEGSSEAGNLTTYYRWHIPDPIAFGKSLRFEIEHTGPVSNVTGGYVERPDDYASVAFWYQSEPHKPFGSVPPVEERLYYSLDGVQEPTMASVVAQQAGQAAMTADSLHFAAAGPGSALDVEFDVPEAGKYQVAVFLPEGPGSGNYQVYLNGEAQGPYRTLYQAARYSPGARVIGTFELAKRKYRLRFECVGKSPLSRGYDIDVGAVTLTPR
jgi:hypothetical protein